MIVDDTRWLSFLTLIAVVTLLIAGSGHAGSPESDAEQLATSQPSGEDINWQVISSGGTNAESANYRLSGTVAQTATGHGSSVNFEVDHGFWQGFGESYICGDADASGGTDIDDVVYLIAYIFSGGPEPSPYESGDADCSGVVDIDDAVWLINYIFSGGNAPCDTDGDGVPDC